jgi:hypothetical protein
MPDLGCSAIGKKELRNVELHFLCSAPRVGLLV